MLLNPRERTVSEAEPCEELPAGVIPINLLSWATTPPQILSSSAIQPVMPTENCGRPRGTRTVRQLKRTPLGPSWGLWFSVGTPNRSGWVYAAFGAQGFLVMALLCAAALPLTRGLRTSA